MKNSAGTHRRRKILLLGIIFALTIGGLSACKENESGVKFLCSEEEKICAKWQKTFTAETGIPTSYLRLPTAEALARLQGESDNPSFDLWVGGPMENYAVAASQGLLEKIDAQLNSEDIPAAWKSEYYFGVYASILGICVDEQLLADRKLALPKSWADLAKIDYHGQIVASSPLTSGTAYTLLWTYHQLYGEDAKNKITPLYQNIIRLTHSGTAPADVVRSGEAPIALSFTPYCETGAEKLKIIYPKEGTGYEVGAAGIIRGAKHFQTAKIFLQWLLSAQGQEIPRAFLPQIPINQRLPGNLQEVLENTQIKVISPEPYLAAAKRKDYLTWFSTEIWGKAKQDKTKLEKAQASTLKTRAKTSSPQIAESKWGESGEEHKVAASLNYIQSRERKTAPARETISAPVAKIPGIVSKAADRVGKKD